MGDLHRNAVAKAAGDERRESARGSIPRGIDPAARTSKRAYDALNASSVGLELGIAVALGLLVGWYLDQRLGTEPWMMLGWLVLGLVAGFRGVFRAIQRADRAAADEEARHGRP